MIFLKKKFDWANPNLPKAVKLVKVDWVLFEVKEDIEYPQILEILDSNGYRGADYFELLGFQDEWDEVSTVIAPGTLITFEEEKYCPCFSMKYYCTPEGCRTERKLGMINVKWRWKAPFKILAVKI